MNKNDLRAQRTFHKINKNFKILLGRVGFRKMNVAMITDHANMNRSTFYSHFNDKRHLYEHHLSMLIDSFKLFSVENIIDKPDVIGELSMLHNFEDALEAIKSEKDYVLEMFHIENPQDLSKTYLKNSTEKFAKAKVKVANTEVSVSGELVVTYCMSLIVTTIKWWLTQESNLTHKEVAQVLQNVLVNSPFVN